MAANTNPKADETSDFPDHVEIVNPKLFTFFFTSHLSGKVKPPQIFFCHGEILDIDIRNDIPKEIFVHTQMHLCTVEKTDFSVNVGGSTEVTSVNPPRSLNRPSSVNRPVILD